MSAGPEKLKLIRRYNEQVDAKRELIQQFEKYGIESPLSPSKYMKFPVAGSTKRDKNQETKQPPRAVYIDPKKKKRWTAAGKDQPDSGTGYEQYLTNSTSNSYEDYMQDSGTKSYDEYLSK
jgi:hypothetical protein